VEPETAKEYIAGMILLGAEFYLPANNATPAGQFGDTSKSFTTRPVLLPPPP